MSAAKLMFVCAAVLVLATMMTVTGGKFGQHVYSLYIYAC